MPASIGLIISSIRQPRINPQIAQFVLQIIQNSLQTSSLAAQPSFKTIDLAQWNLPMTGEPGIPVRIKDPSEYKHESTRAWSREIASHDAIIFVSPQYNWGYPAALKNAIDHLFNEWTGKPAMIVTYGGHGGGQCAEQLATVLKGLRMMATASHVELTYPDAKFTAEKAFPGGDLGLDASSDQSVWAEEREKIVSVFGELMALLEKGKQE